MNTTELLDLVRAIDADLPAALGAGEVERLRDKVRRLEATVVARDAMIVDLQRSLDEAARRRRG